MTTVHINGVGRAHMDALAAAGKGSDSPWNAPKGGDASWYLAVDTSEPATAEAHYKYPFTSDGKTVNRKALSSIESYATQNGLPDIAAAAKSAAAQLDAHARNMSEFREAGTGTSLKGVEIFKTGTWRGSREVKVTPEMLSEIVSNFHSLNKSVPGFGVPIKLGHNDRVGEPAYGWMSDLVNVDDTLVADFADVDPAIVDAIGKRSYNSVSIELRPAVKYGDKTINNVLSGVALLGAEWPAVKGLKPLSASLFSEAEEKIELKERLNVPNFTEEQHNTLLAAAVAAAKTEMQATVDGLTAKLAATNAELASFKDNAEKAEIAAVIKTAEEKGQIVPALKPKVEAFAEQVRKATGEGRKALLDAFKEFVVALPVKVEFGTRTTTKQNADGESAHETVLARVADLRGKDAKLSYEAAVDQVFAADPELKASYAKEIA